LRKIAAILLIEFIWLIAIFAVTPFGSQLVFSLWVAETGQAYPYPYSSIYFGTAIAIIVLLLPIIIVALVLKVKKSQSSAVQKSS